MLREIADPISRVPPHGAWLWRLKAPVRLPRRQIEIIGEICAWPILPRSETMLVRPSSGRLCWRRDKSD